jgi:hypothetical protein
MKKIFTLLLAAASTVGVMAANDGNVVKYDFENYELIPSGNYSYYAWHEQNADNTKNELWASGNPAFVIAMNFSDDKTPTGFPSVAIAEGYEGACVKLETKSTGKFAASLFGMGIAAGNLFTGTFNSSIATSKPMEATQFGKPFYRKPVKFTGYYKYAAGASMQDGKGNAVAGTDKGQIYSVLYRNVDASGNSVVLNGEDILTNENIVAVADAGDITDVADWTLFNAEFKYKEGKEIDEAILKAGGYSMATVFTSSIQGAKFIGAVGSTLYIDKVAIECEPETTEYKGNLTVTMGTSSFPTQETSIYITEQTDGKYTLTLKNFTLMEAGVGTIIVKDVEGTEQDGKIRLQSNQTIEIQKGDDPNISDWMGPDLGSVPVVIDATMTDAELNATITINMLGGINVTFGGTVTGISNVVAADNKVLSEGIYNINGVKVNDMRKGGVYIIRTADGTTKKVIKK